MKKKKTVSKKLLFILFSIFTIFVAVFCVVWLSPKGSGGEMEGAPLTPIVFPHASWSDHYFSLEEIIEKADAVLIGKVTGSEKEQRVDMIFTLQRIEPVTVYQGELKSGEFIRVLQTGGELNGISTPAFEEAPLLKNDEICLFFLRYTEEGHYLVMGGYQGLGRIENDKVKFSIEEDEIAKALSGRNLNEIEEMLTKLTK